MDVDLLERAIKLLHGRLAVHVMDQPSGYYDKRDEDALKLAVTASKEIGRPIEGLTTE